MHRDRAHQLQSALKNLVADHPPVNIFVNWSCSQAAFARCGSKGSRVAGILCDVRHTWCSARPHSPMPYQQHARPAELSAATARSGFGWDTATKQRDAGSLGLRASLAGLISVNAASSYAACQLSATRHEAKAEGSSAHCHYNQVTRIPQAAGGAPLEGAMLWQRLWRVTTFQRASYPYFI